MIDLHEKRLDNHDIECEGVKNSMKFKVSRWIFIIVIGLFGSGLGFQINTLNNVSKKVNEIGEKVAVLCDRDKSHNTSFQGYDNKEQSEIKTAENTSKTLQFNRRKRP
jgi:hypothetical protein